MIQIVVLVYAGPGGVDAMKLHHAKVMPLVFRHGGQLLSTSCPSAQQPGDPDTVHILQFPDMQAFEDYCKDPEFAQHEESRANAIADARLYITNEFIAYLD